MSKKQKVKISLYPAGDSHHAKASRDAMLAYAESIKNHDLSLANLLWELVDQELTKLKNDYSYKYVRDLLPPYLTIDNQEYEGSADHDGDLWIATKKYILELEHELAEQYKLTKQMRNEKLLYWLKNRPAYLYNNGPAIEEEEEGS